MSEGGRGLGTVGPTAGARAQGEGALEGAAERAEAQAQPYLKGKGKLRGSRQKSEKFPCLGTDIL